MKQQVDTLDAIPSKRIYLSIIADYDLKRSICELVDNGLDVWAKGGKATQITIKVSLDKIQQTIRVEDNAGGLAKSELRYIVGPGQTGTAPTDETIGMFGVGTKRAVVALAQDIKIRTRYRKQKTYQVEYDDDWLQDDSWELPLYEVDEITKGTTIVELQSLRIEVTDGAVDQLKDHLRATYAKFLVDQRVTLEVNGERVQAKFFENWAFPPKYSQPGNRNYRRSGWSHPMGREASPLSSPLVRRARANDVDRWPSPIWLFQSQASSVL